MPLRCLYSKDVGNLMMAGRCISVSHAALGATRVMITCGLQGQAVGTAAAQCKLHQTLPRPLGENYISDLQQQLLKDGCYLIDLPNEDPRDLARQGVARASSESPPVKMPEMPNHLLHPLGCPRAVMFHWAGGPLGPIALHLVSTNRGPTPLTLTLRPAKNLDDFSSTTDLATATATVPPRAKGWIKFDVTATVEPGYYYVMLPKTAGVGWSLFEEAPPDTARAYHNGRQWEGGGECYKFRLGPEAAAAGDKLETTAPPAPRQLPPDMFAAANVLDGYARAIRGVPHSWRPDPKQPLPQWVEIDLGRRMQFDCVHVSFQSKAMRADDFRIEAGDGEQWRTVADVKDNTDRRRVLSFERTVAAKLRLVITKARPDMGVCEIRMYDEPGKSGLR